jgi:hypothetical protein
VPTPVPNDNTARIGYPAKCKNKVKTIKLITVIIPNNASKISANISIKKSYGGANSPDYGLKVRAFC